MDVNKRFVEKKIQVDYIEMFENKTFYFKDIIILRIIEFFEKYYLKNKLFYEEH